MKKTLLISFFFFYIKNNSILSKIHTVNKTNKQINKWESKKIVVAEINIKKSSSSSLRPSGVATTTEQQQQLSIFTGKKKKEKCSKIEKSFLKQCGKKSQP